MKPQENQTLSVNHYWCKPTFIPIQQKCYQHRQNTDMAVHLINIQDKMANALCEVQQLCSTDLYMANLQSCTGDSSKELNSWLLSIEKVSKLTGNDPKKICFTKAEGNLLSFYIYSNIHKLSWYPFKENM